MVFSSAVGDPGLSCSSRPDVLLRRSNSHPVAGLAGCTNIPHSAAAAQGGETNLQHGRFYAKWLSGSPSWIRRG